jgi:hypothetical protein
VHESDLPAYRIIDKDLGGIMKKNMGTIDRIIRTILALVVLILYLNGNITGGVAIILGIFAIVFLVTSAIGFCPMYALLHISTIGKSKKS